MNNMISELRQQHNLTQQQLGDAVGVTRQTIIAVEKGKYTPSLPLALKLSRYFKLPTDHIFTLHD